jgi:hypothetical protein
MRQIKQGENLILNHERAFAEIGNFVKDPNGVEIEDNLGQAWDAKESQRKLWA